MVMVVVSVHLVGKGIHAILVSNMKLLKDEM